MLRLERHSDSHNHYRPPHNFNLYTVFLNQIFNILALIWLNNQWHSTSFSESGNISCYIRWWIFQHYEIYYTVISITKNNIILFDVNYSLCIKRSGRSYFPEGNGFVYKTYLSTWILIDITLANKTSMFLIWLYDVWKYGVG